MCPLVLLLTDCRCPLQCMTATQKHDLCNDFGGNRDNEGKHIIWMWQDEKHITLLVSSGCASEVWRATLRKRLQGLMYSGLILCTPKHLQVAAIVMACNVSVESIECTGASPSQESSLLFFAVRLCTGRACNSWYSWGIFLSSFPATS